MLKSKHSVLNMHHEAEIMKQAVRTIANMAGRGTDIAWRKSDFWS